MKNSNLEVTGIEANDQKELKRAFDFQNAKVNPQLKKPEKLILSPDKFKVSGDGVFYTVQGEGVSMGKPCCFLRLHICNLKCTWCDAWYTWNPNTPEFWTESQDWSIEKTKTKLNKCWGCTNKSIKKRVVITGGEPLLQKDKIEKLIDLIPDWDVEIETNGTIMPTKKLLQTCQFNCSPKLENSGNLKISRIKPNVIKSLSKANTIFKFVVMTKADLDEIEKEFTIGLNMDPNKIVVMPQGVTPEEVRKNSRRVINLVKEKGYRILGRLHVDIWGAKRKV